MLSISTLVKALEGFGEGGAPLTCEEFVKAMPGRFDAESLGVAMTKGGFTLLPAGRDRFLVVREGRDATPPKVSNRGALLGLEVDATVEAKEAPAGSMLRRSNRENPTKGRPAAPVVSLAELFAQSELRREAQNAWAKSLTRPEPKAADDPIEIGREAARLRQERPALSIVEAIGLVREKRGLPARRV